MGCPAAVAIPWRAFVLICCWVTQIMHTIYGPSCLVRGLTDRSAADAVLEPFTLGFHRRCPDLNPDRSRQSDFRDCDVEKGVCIARAMRWATVCKRVGCNRCG